MNLLPYVPPLALVLPSTTTIQTKSQLSLPSLLSPLIIVPRLVSSHLEHFITMADLSLDETQYYWEEEEGLGLDSGDEMEWGSYGNLVCFHRWSQ